ncbi:MAG TPA: type II toxin-antitoxin system RelE/ParE family toxin [Phycisphaerae bacterium]|jgi:addiction module RelE/StbE family toxin|nr:type II toxin-antitoxin system RelE/ParE family toxin [Phycisphaerae bacterium]
MTYKVNVTPQAIADLREIHATIVEDSPSSAKRVLDLLEKACETLADFPKRHPVAPESAHESTEIRQIVVLRYRVLFRIIGDTVHVLRVRHGAQQHLRPGELN